MKFIGIIPARYASTRFPAKPLAMLGGKSRYLTSLPDNPIARAFAAQLGGMGCDVSRIHYDKQGRMGVYYA